MDPTAILTSPLVPRDRIPRQPLHAWADGLRAQLTRCRRGTRTARGYAERVAGVANNAALIAAHAGARARARALCQRQIVWQARLGRRARDATLVARAIQPWVNLGRLDTLAGDWRAAQERFAVLRPLDHTEALRLGSLAVPSRAWKALAATDSASCRVLELMYVGETLWSLLLNREYARAVDAARGMLQDALSPDARWSAGEAEVVGLAYLDELDAAAAAADRFAQAARGWAAVAFRVRTAEVRARAGDRRGAAEILGPLVPLLAQVRFRDGGVAHGLPILLRVFECWTGIGGEPRAALALVRAVYARAIAVTDEALQIDSLRLLVRTDEDHRATWQRQLDALELQTGYARYRRRGTPPYAAPALEALYAEVDAILT